MEKFDLQFKNFNYIYGVDEVGRGPLAGPVVSCCTQVKIEENFELIIEFLRELGVNDSKKLSSKKRIKILEKLQVDLDQLRNNTEYKLNILDTEIPFYISEVSPEKIDEINILQASLLSMKESVLGLKQYNKSILLIDGNKYINKENIKLDMQTVIKGDSKSVFIGLASVIAKEYRDLKMKKYSEFYPEYGLDSHSGYPTASHKEAISIFGVTPIHRKSFKGVKEFLNF